jgi:pimeloyl-[acyl-carrier protein] methyl ester esterase
MGSVTGSKKIPLVLLHGWGLNQRIWDVGQGAELNQSFVSKLSERFEVHRLDLPGYGNDREYDGEYRLPEIAARVLEQASQAATNADGAIWVAWSLGATVAMQAAIQEPGRFLGLQLIAPTPHFMANKSWPHGINHESLLQLRKKFETDYQQGLRYFLMLQTSDRNLIRNTFTAVSGMPAPRTEILMRSLNLLTETDLRNIVDQIRVPIQILMGTEDRIVPPNASRKLFEMLTSGNREAVAIKPLPGGHLCFLESEGKYFETLNEFASVTGGL